MPLIAPSNHQHRQHRSCMMGAHRSAPIYPTNLICQTNTTGQSLVRFTTAITSALCSVSPPF